MSLAAKSASVTAIARHLGVSQARVSQWAAPDHEAAISFGDLLAAPPAVARTALLAGLALVEEHAPVAPLAARIGVDRRALRATVAHGRLVDRVEGALADGVITPNEAREIVRAAREARARLDLLEQEVALAATGGTR